MARPLSATDDDILETAELVMAEYGPQSFSVSEVARRIGLSRAAITARFKDHASLKRSIFARATSRLESEVGGWPIQAGEFGLLMVASGIGRMVGDPASFGNFISRLADNIADPECRDMEIRRGMIVREAVERAMPNSSVSKAEAVDAFMAHITGSLISWQSRQGIDAEAFLVERTRSWLRLAGLSSGQDRE